MNQESHKGIQADQTEVSFRGKTFKVPSLCVDDKVLVITGKFLRIASIKGEAWLENGKIGDPLSVIEKLRVSRTGIDIFTFSERLPDVKPKYNFHIEWENVAALPIKTFDYWWTSQINDKTRNMVRRAAKKGVTVRVAEFDDTFVEGISDIYNETPVRQGRPFWHYGKDVDTVRKENATFLERSDFIGAYCGSELIGFVKLVHMGKVAGMMQILSKVRERDKAPNNALLSKVVEICAEMGIEYVVYSKFTYGKKVIDPLADFKRHNAFQKIDIPRYYVPLNIRGTIGLKLGLHHDLGGLLPEGLVSHVRRIRAKLLERRT
jgi:hypothetical protein